MNKLKLTKKELEIMNILWEAQTDLTARQIVDSYPSIVMSTAQNVLNKLLKKDLIKIEKVILEEKNFSRSFIPIISQEEYVLQQYNQLKVTNLLVSLLGKNTTSEDDIHEIENIIADYKQKLLKND